MHKKLKHEKKPARRLNDKKQKKKGRKKKLQRHSYLKKKDKLCK
jgi:hypothetical protein